MTVEARVAGRAIVLDPAGRVLLLHGGDPARPQLPAWWITPGGGVEAGETTRDAAVRELFEETGLTVELDAEPVHHDVVRFAFNNGNYLQTQEFYLGRLDRDVTLDLSGRTELEASYLTGYRWWSADELRTTNETFYPANLADLVDAVDPRP